MPLIVFSPSTKAKSADINTNLAGLADGSFMTAPTIDEATLTDLKQVQVLYDNGNSGASKTITWTNGLRQKLTITATTTLSFSGAVAGMILILEVIIDSTGGYTITLPTVKWPQQITQSFDNVANRKNILQILYDGTDYLAQIAPGYA